MLNLIITCARHLEPETEEEMMSILEKYGDSDAKITITKKHLDSTYSKNPLEDILVEKAAILL